MLKYCQDFFLDLRKFLHYYNSMEKITYNTRVDPDLLKEFKILAIRRGLRQSVLLEEAIRDLLKKYQKPASKKKSQT